MSRSASGLLTALLSGLIFGFGLAFARMTDPQKIKDFLDLAAIPAGGWDPSLAFVMGGGLIVAFIGLRLDGWSHIDDLIALDEHVPALPTVIDAIEDPAAR